MLSGGSHSGVDSPELHSASATFRKEIFALLIAKCLGYSFLGSVFTAALSRALPLPLVAFGLRNETQEQGACRVSASVLSPSAVERKTCFSSTHCDPTTLVGQTSDSLALTGPSAYPT